MRYASVWHNERPLAVAVDDDRVIPLRGITELGRDTPLSRLTTAERDHAAALPRDEVRLRPLIPAPDKIICIGLNYAAHAEEARRATTDYPVLFTKFRGCLCAPGDDIPCPPESTAVDYEGELAVVIGERVRRISPALALQAVAGLAVANDVSMRDFQNKTHQWLQGKAWEASTPVGPEVVTLDEVGDLAELHLRTVVNGQTVQDTTTDLMLFDIPTLVSVISQFITLEPGDLILTGTPSGIGFRREPPLLLGDGDVVRVEVPGVGRIENRFVREMVPA